ncbi:MAG: sugar ABC transporter permease [Thermoleophilia bacterium]
MSTDPVTQPPVDDIALRDRDADRGLAAGYLEKLKSGDLGSLPVILGLVLVWVIFYFKNSNFISAFNLTNLSLQITAYGIAATGVVMVLLLGEIDLAMGSVSGLAAAVTTVWNLDHGVPGVLSVVMGLVVGAVIGGVHAFFITKVGVPSFVVTLAGFIGWAGALLKVLGSGGSRNVTDSFTLHLTDKFFGGAVAWPLVIILLLVMVGADHIGRRRRVAAGLEVGPFAGLLIREVAIAVVALVAVSVWMNDRGLPLAVLIMLAIVVGFDLIIRRTLFGRHVFAVGGSKEAARRAGISVTRITTIVFVLSGLLAAAAGIMAASRGLAVNQQSGSGTFLLNCIAAAVIGGTSLFGGRGSVYSALLGALVIGSVSNGIALVGLTSDYEQMITAIVLLAAVVVDAVARRGRQSAGR